MNIYYEFKLR
jgi:hypothetical protein